MDSDKNESLGTLSDQAKVISLFQFIQELNKLKQKAILNIKEYPWSFSLSDIPDDPKNIFVHYPDRVAEEVNSEKSEDAELILSVHKPEFQKCPEPELSFAPWLNPGWDDFRQEASVVLSMPGKEIDEKPARQLLYRSQMILSGNSNTGNGYQSAASGLNNSS